MAGLPAPFLQPPAPIVSLHRLRNHSEQVLLLVHLGDRLPRLPYRRAAVRS